MAVTTPTLTALYDYLKTNGAPVEYQNAVSELIVKRNARNEQSSAKRKDNSTALYAPIAHAVERIVNSNAFGNLKVVMNADVRTALQNEGVKTPTIAQATRAINEMVNRGYLIECVPPKGVSCRCYSVAA